MSTALVIAQVANGLQLGMILFLLAAGLTLVFGILDVVNLAHGAFYMLGAYAAATVALWTGSFWLGLLAALPATALIAVIVELLVIRRLYERDHLDQVLATFGLILIADTAVQYLWGPDGMTMAPPLWVDRPVDLGLVTVPGYRLLIVAAGLAIAGGLFALINGTRAGMLIRASASNPRMAQALGVDTGKVSALVFGLGAVLAGIAGLLIAPITGASIGMGNQIIITAFVVIIIGGIGSVKGAFVAALGVGLIDTLGRAFLPDLLRALTSPDVASAAGPALASIMIYLVMAVILAVRPAGLFPPVSR